MTTGGDVDFEVWGWLAKGSSTYGVSEAALVDGTGLDVDGAVVVESLVPFAGPPVAAGLV